MELFTEALRVDILRKVFSPPVGEGITTKDVLGRSKKGGC